MPRIKQLFMAVLVAALLTGCGEKTPEPTESQDTPGVNARAAYAAAKSAVDKGENLILDYTLRETRQVGGNTFTQTVTGKGSFCGYGQPDMTAVVEESLDFGVYSCAYSETFCQGKAYFLVNDCRFWSNLSAEDFILRQLPPALLTPVIYDRVTYSGDGRQILFSQPKRMESWVGEGQLLDASGSATLDAQGNLLQTEYQVQFQRGDARYTREVTVKVLAPESLDLSGVHMDHTQVSTFLSHPDAPRYLVQVVADVYAADAVDCRMNETITSEAIPLSYSRLSRVALKGRGETLHAEILNDATVSNNRETVKQSSQGELFRDGVYTLSVDGSEPARNGSVTAQAMRQYAEDTVLSGLLAVKYLKGVSAEEDAKRLHLEFIGNDSYRQVLAQQLKGVLQVDLDAKAQSVRNIRSGAYLTLDLETGLPVAMGLYLEKSHTIDGVAYRLAYQLDEELSFTEESRTPAKLVFCGRFSLSKTIF